MPKTVTMLTYDFTQLSDPPVVEKIINVVHDARKK